ncbi:FAD/NAD(P)-binding domain-containing protein [Aspergillus violaceofuscus CBS 115571]|uniref:FAD/NAD(P)-binding domain-containing protein n=1 Tax=Aspergillus violaceofuscus (strain CBS 115571) TaxID=1450538 RepID=A0A2V5HAN0_ASPV1|nr:FAD/NAD(P)-binding domain-containing protein [Aspergillus violaceofuscus CBS 115571]
MAWPSLSGSDLNWQFTIVSQKGLNRRCQEYPAGHVLGGSSAINGLALVPPSAAGLNAWEQMGNPGWNWETLSGYLQRSFNGPGPIRLSSPALAQEGNQPLIQAWNADFSDQAYAYTSELVVENPTVGTRPYSATIDPECARRSSADVAYGAVAAQRSIALCLTRQQSGASFERPGSGSNLPITQIPGVFQTPKLLELSGVGDPAVLAAHNIPVVIGNPGVGANLQNHSMAILSSPLSRNPETRDLNPGLQALAFVRLDDQEDLRLLDQFLSSDRSAASGRAQAIGSILANPNEALACVFLGKMPGPVALLVLIPLLSAFFSRPLDLELMAHHWQALQRLPIAPSLRKFFDRDAAPTEASLKNTKAALREAALTTHHACGSAAKLPLEKGGVVDTTLTVYGTTNLRVVDAIIFPLMSHAKPDGNGKGCVGLAVNFELLNYECVELKRIRRINGTNFVESAKL